ncbi:ABC transporter ATP-binding protein [Deinococcus rubellus]|uniref:ABC transporter ATP-binding protein n=1 Tax=Deinococcus rubellus TaxID=1889240 RepID=A0ABY5YKZ5_9DEIO|nr:ABC transporter ATP-binding protein [Deinococcus rubellus]UWX64806.1 ABC transporter ATP-binding protein [Deinococcus rubellus]
MAEIDFSNISKLYAGKPAVNTLNLQVASGELVCLLGPSGCGKTTSLRMLAGFLTPDAGDITLDGRSLLPLGPEARPTAMVFQRYTLWPHMNVFHNVAFGLKLRRVSKADVARRVGQALELVGLPGMEGRSPSQLSGGQQQRVALARALVLEPQVLLLDEPLSSLDAKLRVSLRGEIKAIVRELGITTVFVTHDQEEAMAVADRIAVMFGGELHQADAPGTLYARPATREVADFIGTMNFLPASATGTHLHAGPLAFELAGEPISGPLEVAIRPEDIYFAPSGIPAEVISESDLGHYREMQLRVAGLDAPLLTFVPRGEGSAAAVQVRRAVVYAGGQLVGEAVPVPRLVSR